MTTATPAPDLPGPPPDESVVRRFGTFGGVFTPTLLTILGVIMYLRLGWVVGNAGILGAFLIIAIAYLITITTGLSMSSITTNIRIGSGGAYAIISQSLGLEVGGSLGIPRYISQGLAVTMYIFGFREGWLWIFPGHPAFLVDLAVFLLLYGIAYKSADLAIRTQYVIMAIIALSLVSVIVAAVRGSMQYEVTDVGLWGSFPGAPETDFGGTDFWTVFAVFFPAATGIMAGANMSGELKDPRRSIPIGTMAAIGISLFVYLGLAYWIARSASPAELVQNYNVIIDKAFWGPIVVAGVLGATFSSALGSMVGSSRILQAMGEHRVLTAGPWLAHRTTGGEPRNAMMITGGMVFLTMLLRDLNAVAPLVTMFFLITYAMLNVVVLIEQNLGLISFRPLFSVPRLVPWIGLISSVVAMFIIHPTISLVSWAVVLGFYGVLSRRRLEAPFEDVRSGLFVSFAEWAAKHTAVLPTKQERAWKPNLLVPVDDVRTLSGTFLFLQQIAYPKGSVKLLGVGAATGADDRGTALLDMARAFQKRGVFASWADIRADRFADGTMYGMQALRGAFFRPNIVFLNTQDMPGREDDFRVIVLEAARLQLGVLLFAPHPRSGLGMRQTINVWIRDRSPDWRISWDIGNLDLSILVAYKLKRNWPARLRLITVVEDPAQEANARAFMRQLMDLARLPETDVVVGTGSFRSFVHQAPVADLHIFGMLTEPDFALLQAMVDETRAACLFVRDSGLENVLA